MKTGPKQLLLLALTCLLPALSHAATFTVTTTNDGAGGSLRVALASAFNGDTVDATSVSNTILLTLGELVVNHSITILGPGSDVLAVNGGFPATQNRVFHIAGAGTVTISGLLITGGCATNGTFPVDAGAGIYNVNSTLILSNCTVAGNTAYWGAGIYNYGENGSATLTLLNTTVSGNYATGSGGGIYNDGEFGIANLTVSNSDIFSIASFEGGGIVNLGDYGSATLLVTASTIHNSIAQNGNGGGIATSSYSGTSKVTITNSTLSGNLALARSGGGLYNTDSGGGHASVTVRGSTFYHNKAHYGGAIYNRGTLDALVTVINSTISGNSASNQFQFKGGGGIYNDGESHGNATVKIFNSTFSGNTFSAIVNDAMSTGGALVELGNSILDAGDSEPNLYNQSGTFHSDGFNLSSDDGSSLLIGVNDQIITDPMLDDLADNGGLTRTHNLLPGSPAIDKGSNLNAYTTDQRGLPRTYNDPAVADAGGGDGTDIGAVELSPPPVPRLIVTRSGNQVTISWPASLSSWTLQTNNNLTTSTWGNYQGTIVNNNATISAPPGIQFFRLKQ